MFPLEGPGSGPARPQQLPLLGIGNRQIGTVMAISAHDERPHVAATALAHGVNVNRGDLILAAPAFLRIEMPRIRSLVVSLTHGHSPSGAPRSIQSASDSILRFMPHFRRLVAIRLLAILYAGQRQGR